MSRALHLGLAFALCLNAAQAREIFVAPTGNDSSGTGSLANPYRSLSFVLEPINEVVEAGDIITLRGGAAGTSAIYAADEYRLRTRLTLRSFAGEWAILRCPITVPDGICLQIDPDASGCRAPAMCSWKTANCMARVAMWLKLRPSRIV